MKTLLLTLLFATAVFAQSGRSVTLTWTDPNIGVTGQTYSVYRAAGVCPAPPAVPVFPANPLAAGITAKTYTDANVPIGVYCYAATVTAGTPGNVESAKSTGAPAVVSPNAVTITVVVVQ